MLLPNVMVAEPVSVGANGRLFTVIAVVVTDTLPQLLVAVSV